MRNIFSNIVAAIATIALFSACNDASSFNGMDEESFEPKFFEVTSENTVNVIDANGVVLAEKVNHNWALEAQSPFLVEGKEAIASLAELRSVAAPTVRFYYNYDIENKLTVTGLTMSYAYEGRTYDLICRTAVNVEGVLIGQKVADAPYTYDATTAYKLVSGNGFTLAEATQEFRVREDAPVFVETKWTYKHGAFRRNATFDAATSIAKVGCINTAKFADLHSDNQEYNQHEEEYEVENNVRLAHPDMEVEDLKSVVGNTFLFNNDKVVVEGVECTAEWLSAHVVGSVLHNEKDYAGEITPCRVHARTITYTSATTATIRFYEEDATDYAEVSVPVRVTEKAKPVTLTGVERSFIHDRLNPVVKVNNTLEVTDENHGEFVAVYSDDHRDAAVNVEYTWSYRYRLNMPTIKLAAKNHSYNFNSGTAAVEGDNVTLERIAREISDIIYGQKNYKDEAPVCEVAAKSIAFGETTATITFEHDGETATAVVPVSYEQPQPEPEVIDLAGEIVAGWMTDSYMNQDAQREGTYLHILAKQADGTYVDHVRKEGESSFTPVALSATEGASIISSNRAAAYVYNGSSYFVGTVTSTEAGGYNIISYFDLQGNLAYVLGKANQTIAGKFRNPIVDTLKDKGNGIYELNGELFK